MIIPRASNIEDIDALCRVAATALDIDLKDHQGMVLRETIHAAFLNITLEFAQVGHTMDRLSTIGRTANWLIAELDKARDS